MSISVIPFCGFLVTSLSDLGISNVDLHKVSWEVFPLLQFSRRVGIELLWFFFFKCSVEFISEYFLSLEFFFVRRFLNRKFSFFNRSVQVYLFLLQWALVACVFQKLIYWYKGIHNNYYPFDICILIQINKY